MKQSEKYGETCQYVMIESAFGNRCACVWLLLLIRYKYIYLDDYLKHWQFNYNKKKYYDYNNCLHKFKTGTEHAALTFCSITLLLQLKYVYF